MRGFCVILFLTLFSMGVAAQTPFFSSQINESAEYVDVQARGIEGFTPEFNSQSMKINISESNRTINEISTYRSYVIEIENTNVINMNLVLNGTSLNKWADRNRVERDNIILLTSDNAFMRTHFEEDYFSNVTVVGKVAEITVVGSNRVKEELSLAVSPDDTTCREYWRPEDNYTLVENCKGKVEVENNISDKILFQFIAFGILFVITVSGLLLYLKSNGDDSEDIQSITEDIIEGMETGSIPRDEEVLDQLQRANRLAYNEEYEEASRLLEQVKEEIDDRHL